MNKFSPFLNIVLILALSSFISPKLKRQLIVDYEEEELDLSKFEITDSDERIKIKNQLTRIFQDLEYITRRELRDLVCRHHYRVSYDTTIKTYYKHRRHNDMNYVKGYDRDIIELYEDIDDFMMELKSLTFDFDETLDILATNKYIDYYHKIHEEDIKNYYYESLHASNHQVPFKNTEL